MSMQEVVATFSYKRFNIDQEISQDTIYYWQAHRRHDSQANRGRHMWLIEIPALESYQIATSILQVCRQASHICCSTTLTSNVGKARQVV